MGNIIQIKSGTGSPGNKLKANELGYDTQNGYLYIGKKEADAKKIKAGHADTADTAEALSKVLSLDKGGTGSSVDLYQANPYDLVVRGFSSLTKINNPQKYAAIYYNEDTWTNDNKSGTGKLTTGILPLKCGGTGTDLSIKNNNSVIIKSSNVGLGAIDSKKGAFYSSENQSLPSFDTLPVDCGGTGCTDVDGFLNHFIKNQTLKPSCIGNNVNGDSTNKMYLGSNKGQVYFNGDLSDFVFHKGDMTSLTGALTNEADGIKFSTLNFKNGEDTASFKFSDEKVQIGGPAANSTFTSSLTYQATDSNNPSLFRSDYIYGKFIIHSNNLGELNPTHAGKQGELYFQWGGT